MRTYELFFILPGTLTEAESGKRAEEVTAAVRGIADSAELHPLGKNRLAYPIRQIRYGYYFTVVFSAAPTQVQELVERLRLSRDLLRGFLTYFNLNLTARENIAYTTEPRPAATAWERVAPVTAAAVVSAAAAAPTSAASAPPPPAARGLPLAEPDLAAINKKLEELIGSGEAPTV